MESANVSATTFCKVLLAVCLIGSMPAMGANPKVFDLAVRQFDELDYEGALVALRAAEASKLTPEQLAAVYALRGAILVELGKTREGANLFSKALDKFPGLKLPFRASRKTIALFEAQRSALAERPGSAPASPPPSSAKKKAAPRGNQTVTRQTADAEAAPSSPKEPSVAPTAVQSDAPSREPKLSAGLDLREPKPVSPPPASVEVASTELGSPAASGRRFSLLTKLFAGGAVAAAATGGFFAIRVGNANSAAAQAVYQDDAIRHQASARAQVPVANTLLAAGAGLAVTAIVHHLVFDNP